MRRYITLALIGFALLSCAQAVSAQHTDTLYRAPVRFVRPTRVTADSVCYRVLTSEASPTTIGRIYCATRRGWTDAKWIPYPGPMPELPSMQPQQPQPEPPVETPRPAPSDPSGALYATSFEDGRPESGCWSWSSASSRVSLSTDRAYSGTHSLRFRYGPDARGGDSSAEQRFRIACDAATAPREVWIEFMWYVPSNYKHRNDSPANNKLFTLWAENYSAAQEAQFFLSLERAGDVNTTLDIIAVHGDDPRYPNDSRFHGPGFVTSSDLGRWMQVRIHARIARDGFVRVWKNGVLHVETGPYNTSRSDGQWDYFRHGYLMGWSNSGYTQQTDFYVDDFKVFTKNPGW